MILHQRFMFSPILHWGDVRIGYHNFPMWDTREREREYILDEANRCHGFGCHPVWLCKIPCERAFLCASISLMCPRYAHLRNFPLRNASPFKSGRFPFYLTLHNASLTQLIFSDQRLYLQSLLLHITQLDLQFSRIKTKVRTEK